MLRIKRSVEHQYNTQVNMMSAQMLSGALASSEEVIPTPGDSMKDLDKASIPNAGGDKENVPKKKQHYVCPG